MSIDYSEWIGAPFEWCGKYDCWTLTKAFLAEHGVDLPEYDYTKEDLDDISRSVALAAGTSDWVEVAVPEPLDVVLLGANDFFTHIGVYVGNDQLLHTTPRTGALVQRLSRITRHGPYRQWRAYRWVG